jgi:predicted acyl esterase
MHCKLRLAVTLTACVLLVAIARAAGKFETKTIFGLEINTTDNVTLTADVTFPVVSNSSGDKGPFPLLIFPNSWGVPEFEYITKNLALAADGYVTLEYQTRGWYFSGGEIDTAGPKDREDISNVIDFAERHAAQWNANMSAIAFIGISYGAGLSLEAVGHDPRVATACALSGWVNLTKLLYYHQSPNLDAIGLLKSGAAVGRLDPTLVQMFNQLLAHENMSALMAFADERSPERYLPRILSRKVPIFISNNMLDRLFVPQEMLGFYHQLPKGLRFMMLNQGTHALPEGLGMFVGKSIIWANVRRWIDYWLKGIPTGIVHEPSLQMQLGNDIFSTDYQDFEDANWTEWELFFGPRGTNPSEASFGTLAATPWKSNGKDTIVFDAHPTLVRDAKDSDMLSSLLGIPFVTDLMLSPETSSAIYMTPAALPQTNLCGTPRLTLTVETSAIQWQVYGYLYDVVAATSSNGTVMGYNGTVISDFDYTNWAVNYDEQEKRSTTTLLRDVEMRSLCRAVPEGHRIAVGFVLYSKHREPANNMTGFSLSIDYAGVASNVLVLPYIK